ncbi:TonB-dependent receptor plug domain-containing protein [Rubrivirga sp. IMCC45206]|uniref:TonB-dependent receptor plug domain-containing protein n=1 Tax=Rubrivirga sp. IMCC45206 TaxID=3391614 RepID=UPI00398FDB94
MLRRLSLLAVLLAPLAGAAQPGDDLGDLESLLDEPVQTAATYTQRSSEAPASVTIVTRDEIDRAGYRTLAEALNSVRGFYLSDDRNYTYVGVRGLSRPSDYNNRIAILVDGVASQEGSSGSGAVGSELGIPLSAVDRIEVIRGPGSTLYGTGAMFGVVNVILKDSRTFTGVHGVATAGSAERLSGELVASAALGGGVEATVAVHGLEDRGPDPYFAEFDAPETGGGVAAGQDWERAVGALASVRAGDVRLNLRLSERDKGIPTGAFETAFGLDAWTRDRTAAASLRFETDLSPRLALYAVGSVHHAYYYGVYPYDDGDGPYDAYDDSHSSVAQAESRLRWDASASNRVVLGALASANLQSRYRGYDDEATYVVVDEPYRSGALYGQVESQLRDGLAITAGARLDVVRGDVALSPRGAVVVTPDDRTSLKVVVGSAFRAPSTYELGYIDPYTNQIAAPGLRPEYVTTAEASVTREVVPGVRLDGALFVTRVADLIDTREVAGAPGTLQFVNVGRAEARGAEAGVASAVGRWRARASYGLQRTVDPDLGDEPLSNAPTHVGKLTAFGPLAGGLALSVSGRAESGRRTVFGEATAGYAVVDAALSADVFGEAARATLGVYNALDADYALPGGFEHLQAAIPQRPRSAYLRLDVRL